MICMKISSLFGTIRNKCGKITSRRRCRIMRLPIGSHLSTRCTSLPLLAHRREWITEWMTCRSSRAAALRTVRTALPALETGRDARVRVRGTRREMWQEKCAKSTRRWNVYAPIEGDLFKGRFAPIFTQRWLAAARFSRICLCTYVPIYVSTRTVAYRHMILSIGVTRNWQIVSVRQLSIAVKRFVVAAFPTYVCEWVRTARKRDGFWQRRSYYVPRENVTFWGRQPLFHASRTKDR